MRHFQEQVHKTAVEKGWWDTPRTDEEVFCLFQSELYEAFEAYRKGKTLQEVWVEDENR